MKLTAAHFWSRNKYKTTVSLSKEEKEIIANVVVNPIKVQNAVIARSPHQRKTHKGKFRSQILEGYPG